MITIQQEKIEKIVFDIIADIMINKKLQAIILELLIRKLIILFEYIECINKCRKLNISLLFITQSYFSVPKEVGLKSTHYLMRKIHKKRELQEIAINHSAGID